MAYDGWELELPIGSGGFNANQNVSQIQPGELIQALNCTYEFGTLQKEGGSTLYTPTPLTGTPIIYGGWDWWPDPTTQRSVIMAGQTLLKDSGAGSYSTTLASALTVPITPPVFVEGGKEQAAKNKKLFIYTGTNAVQVLSGDGATTTAIGNPPADWAGGQPACGCIHLSRHWGTGGTSDPYRLYYSRILNHEDFLGSTNITGAANNGSGLIRLTVVSTAQITTGDQLTVSGVLGTTEANATWIVTVIDSTHLDLQGSTFTHVYGGGGVIAYADTGGSITVYPGVGSRNMLILSYKRQLIVFRYPKGIFTLDTTDPNIANWTTTVITREIGIAGPASWAFLDDDILFMDASGKFHTMSDVREYGDFGLSSIGEDKYIFNFFHSSINQVQTRMQACQGVLYAHKREAHFALTKKGSTNNNIRLVADLNVQGTIRWRYSDKDPLESLWLIREVSDGIPTVTGGDNVGQVRLLDQANKSVNGTGFNTIFQTAHYDMSQIPLPGMAAKRKRWDALEIVVEPEGNWNLTADIYLDGNFHQTVLFNMGATGGGLDSFVLDSSVLAGNAVLSKRRRLTGSSRRISFWFYINGANQDVSVAKAIIWFKLIDERQP